MTWKALTTLPNPKALSHLEYAPWMDPKSDKALKCPPLHSWTFSVPNRFLCPL